MSPALAANGRGGVVHCRSPAPPPPPLRWRAAAARHTIRLAGTGLRRPFSLICGDAAASSTAYAAPAALQQRTGLVGRFPAAADAAHAAAAAAFSQRRSQQHQRQQRGPLLCRAAAAGSLPAAAAADGGGSQPALNGAAPVAAAAAAAMAATPGAEVAAAAAATAQQSGTGGSLSLADLWALLRPDWRQLALCVTFTAFSVACAVLVAPSLGNVVDIISRGTAATPRELAVAVGRLGTVYIISNVSLAVQVALSLVLGEALAHRLRCRLFGALLQRDTVFYDSVRTGQMVAWLGQDIEVLQDTVAKLLGARGIRSVFETVGIILILFTLSWPLAVVLLVSAPLLTPLIATLGARIGVASKASTAASNEVSASAGEIVENMRVVKLFAQEHRELRRFQGLLDGAHVLALRVLKLQAFLDASSRVRNTLCIMCTLGLGAWMALQGTVSIGTCYSFFVFSFSFAFALGNLTNAVGDVAKAAGAVNRTMATLRQAMGDQGALLTSPGSGDEASELLAPAPAFSAQQQGAGRSLPDSWRGDVEFRGVSFRHPGWTGWTLDGVSFKIPAGKTVALVGPSGGGKSTIASMLMGLYSPAQGSILVDGVPLADLDLQWWRRQLGVVMQDPGLLTGRVADIIRYAVPDASDTDVEWAARAAQAHDFISQLPNGYQTAIGAGSGAELSGGQRQRLAIARALLRRPRVLVLDEATSALDVETEMGVTQELEAAGQGVSSLIIAHRLSTVRRADSIVVVADGHVVETGTHEKLMQRPDGVYWGLVRTAESRGLESWDMPEVGPAGSGSMDDGVTGSTAEAGEKVEVRAAEGAAV